MLSDKSPNPTEEILPHLVFRLSDDQMECAVWRLEEGRKALALFLSSESAEAYVAVANLGPDWKVFQPSRVDLLSILKQSTSTGIDLAVLDPDDKQAKRLFDLREVINAAEHS